MKCFHHNDPDGYCSGFLIYNFYERNIECFAMDYNKKFPLDKIEKNEKIFITDFSIDPLVMTELLKITKDVNWIDHHITAIDKYKTFPFELKGLRSLKKSGCQLTFEYLYPDKKEPLFVSLIGDYDIWKLEYKESKDFILGLLTENIKVDSSVWYTLWEESESEDKPFMNEVLKTGKIISRYRDMWSKTYREKYGYEVKFEGHSCYVMNMGNGSSLNFGNLIKSTDIVAAYVFDGESYIVSLYSEKVDVSEIAKKYGGGGHKGASGFVIKNLPFIKDSEKPIVANTASQQQINQVIDLTKKTISGHNDLKKMIFGLDGRLQKIEQDINTTKNRMKKFGE